MKDDATFDLTRRRALARIGALALAAYAAPAVTTLSKAGAQSISTPVSGPQPSFPEPSFSEPSRPEVKREPVRRGEDRDDSGPKGCSNDLVAKNCDRSR